VPNYAKVRYRSVYPGIDLIYYGNQQQLEYDFVVSAGADPDKILLDFQGATKPALDRSGDLVIHTAAGDLRWHKPIAYQEVNGDRKLIACSYLRKGQRLGFTLAAYDRTKPLIIDPVLVYSTYLGGSGSRFSYIPGESGNAIAVDKNGNAYVTGQTPSGDFPAKSCFQCFRKGVNAVFITKFDSTGKLVYSTYLGGSGGILYAPTGGIYSYGDAGRGIAVDSNGNAFITGYTTAPNFPVKNAFQSSLRGVVNAFVTKLDAAGSALTYSSYLGGGYVDTGFAIAVDAYGSAYVTGATQSANFPTKNAVQKQAARCGNFPSCGRNAFVTKFNVAGSALVYSTYLGGSGNLTSGAGDQGNGIAVDAYGDAYVTGSTTSTNFPTKNALQGQNRSTNGGSNAFLTKFDAAGSALVYSTYLGGSTHYNLGTSGDAGFAITVDAGRNAYITGYTDSLDFPTKYPFQKGLSSSDGNAFVTKLNCAGTALGYSTYLGGGGDRGNGIAVDTHGDAYVAGSTGGNFPTKNAFQGTFKGYQDAFITKFNAFGTGLIYSSYLGGSGYMGDKGNAVAVDSAGNAYVTGFTNSIDFPIKNAFQSELKDARGNAFVTKISAQ
jgi:hypothetical protein